MAGEIVRPSALPDRPSPVASEKVPVDNGSTVGGATIEALVNAGRPLASQAEAELGDQATKAMTPLTTKQAIQAQGDVRFASAAQGALAESAVQPADLAAVATSGAYDDLSGLPTLGTAAAQNVGAFATSAQGAKADTALQSVVAGANTTVDNTDPLNPVVASTGGVSDGDKGDVVVTASGTSWRIARSFDTVSLLLADTDMDYSSGQIVSAGQIVVAQGFRYEVAASGASDQQITTAGGVKLYVLADRGQVVAQQFGAAGDDVTDDAIPLQAWQDFCYEQGARAVIFAKHYCSTNLVIKTDVHGTHRDHAQIVFAPGFGFRTYVSADEFYRVSLFNTGFISDKASYWNSTDAGDAFVGDVTRTDVKRLYGARVWKGNKTTTPNNICANDATERQNGVGFWNKDYLQWMQTAGVAPVVTLAGAPDDTSDCCVFYGLGNPKQIIGCKFQGFGSFIVAGTYNTNIQSNLFEAMKKGIVFADAAVIGGIEGARVTTISFKANEFDDCWIGVYAESLLQSDIDGSNVIQGCIVGIYVGVGGASGCFIDENYFEIGHTLIYWLPNEASNIRVGMNFSNEDYTRFLAWLNSGSRFHFQGPAAETATGTQLIHVAAGVVLSDFDPSFDLMVSPPYFLDNGNAYGRGKPKRSVYSVVGVSGTSATITNTSNDLPTPAGGEPVSPLVTNSQSGLRFSDNITVLGIEVMSEDYDVVETYSLDDPDLPSTTYFISKFNQTTNVYDPIDVRTNAQTLHVRVTWTEKLRAIAKS